MPKVDDQSKDPGALDEDCTKFDTVTPSFVPLAGGSNLTSLA